MRELRSKQTASDAAAGVRKRQYKTARKRRREITTATLEILSEQGMHAWTTSALAARVGVSEATLFRHFRSKDEILISAFRDLVQSIKSRVAEFDGPGAPWERVRGLVFHVLDFVQETGGGPLIIMTGEAIRILPAVREDVLETRLLFRDKLIELVQDALAAHPEARAFCVRCSFSAMNLLRLRSHFRSLQSLVFPSFQQIESDHGDIFLGKELLYTVPVET